MGIVTGPLSSTTVFLSGRMGRIDLGVAGLGGGVVVPAAGCEEFVNEESVR